MCKSKIIVVLAACLIVAFVGCEKKADTPQQEAAENTIEATGEQTLCPVMGNPINKEVFIEYKGKKVYFCCPGCDEKFTA
ncbi:MAG: hypothetical protein ACYSUS_07965, partial [Planctomycetota bacterium]